MWRALDTSKHLCPLVCVHDRVRRGWICCTRVAVDCLGCESHGTRLPLLMPSHKGPASYILQSGTLLTPVP